MFYFCKKCLFNECQTRELLVPFLLRLWYDAVLVGVLNPGPPALKAGTIPLGYRGVGDHLFDLYLYKPYVGVLKIKPRSIIISSPYYLHSPFSDSTLTKIKTYFSYLGLSIAAHCCTFRCKFMHFMLVHSKFIM